MPRSPSHTQARVSALRVTIRATPMGSGRRLSGTGGSIGRWELQASASLAGATPEAPQPITAPVGHRRLGCTRRPRHLHMPGARLRPPRRLTPIVRASRMWSVHGPRSEVLGERPLVSPHIQLARTGRSTRTQGVLVLPPSIGARLGGTTTAPSYGDAASVPDEAQATPAAPQQR